jgi:hypothetical protein
MVLFQANHVIFFSSLSGPAHFFKPFLLILVTRLHVQITAVRYLHESDFLPSQRFPLAIWGVKI